jgi:photosystem II stability/assembly factor-like uncharacterized protein
VAKRRQPPAPKGRSSTVIVGAAALAVAALGLAVFLVLRSSSPAAPEPWATFGSEDVHSLAFVGADPQHLLFGHHGGLEETMDGGRTWSQLPVRDDAMSMSPASDASIVIAGHEVFVASRDGGQTWAPIRGDLPSLDIHGFTRDPGDPARMWAYLATGGLWESTDLGVHWTRVRDDNVLYPTAVKAGATTRLFGVGVNGLNVSEDGGRTWTTLGSPPTYPMTGFAASGDGRIIYAGATDGLFRSNDGGRSWAKTGYSGSAFAVATSSDGQVVALVSRATEFFRSSDGGSTWPGPG